MESPEVWISKMSPTSSTLISPQPQSHTSIELEGRLRPSSPLIQFLLAAHLNVVFLEHRKNPDGSVFLFCRTARADNPGTALSFITHNELELLSEVEEALKGGNADLQRSKLTVCVCVSDHRKDDGNVVFCRGFFFFLQPTKKVKIICCRCSKI